MIAVKVTPGTIEVTTPYNGEFVAFARMRKAIWKEERRAWLFDPRDEFAIRSTLIDIFGTDDYEHCEKVDVRLSLNGLQHPCGHLAMFGWELARRPYRDYSVKLGAHVVVVKGGFPSSGGSRNTPQLEAKKDTVLEIRDVPRIAAEREWSKHPENVEILGGLDRERLVREREQLQKRLDEIDLLLSAMDAKEASDDDVIPDLEDSVDATPESCGLQAVN